MKKEHRLLADKFKFNLADSGVYLRKKSGALREKNEGKGRFDLISPYALLRVARIHEKGSKKYSPRNWEKGMKFSLFVDAAMRHIIKYMMGMTDEDHLAQAVWNLDCLLHFEALIDFGIVPKELNNLPQYQQRESIEAFMKFLNIIE
jgi:hypothetical protein